MLKTGGALTFWYRVNFTDAHNETHGLINLLCFRVGDAPGIKGNGVLATITFKKSTGNAILHLEDVELSDSNANPIPYTITDGQS